MSNLTPVIKSIQDVMRQDAGINGDAQRIEQMVWLLFLKVFDALEEELELTRDDYKSPIPEHLRWRQWAADAEGITGDALLDFVNNTLFPKLKALPADPVRNPRGWVVRGVFEDANNFMKSGQLLRQVINKLNAIDFNRQAERHQFNDLYEKILRDLQSAGNAGEFYTPRAVTQFMVDMVNPQLGEKVLDPATGTGGFLVCAIEHLRKQVKNTEQEALLQSSILGVEKKQLPHLLCVTNLLLHGIEVPSNVRHDNTLARPLRDYASGERVDVVLTNPPFGGIEEPGIEAGFPADVRTKETADLFLVLIKHILKANGRAALVLPDGTLFGEGVKTRIKEQLLAECNLHTIVRLPNGVFAPYTGIKTNLLFFTKGRPTEAIWYYEHPYPAGAKSYNKTKPIRIEEFDAEKTWWGSEADGFAARVENERAWKVDVAAIKAAGYNLDQKNPHAPDAVSHDPDKLLRDYARLQAEAQGLRNELKAILSASLAGDAGVNAVLEVQEPRARDLDAAQPVLVRHFGLLATAPNGIARLRELILMLAVQGKLVPQDPTDHAALDTLKRVQEERDRLIGTGKVKTPKPTKKVVGEELPFEIPPRWEWAHLSDIVRVLNGRAYSKQELLDAGPTPVLRVGNLFTSDHWYYSNLSLDPDKFCNPGDLLFAWSASFGPFIWDGPKAIFHYHIWKLDPIAPRHFDVRYFHLFLREKTAELKAAGHGVSMVHLTKEKMEKIPVPWPPLAEQARIVARVEELMRLCDALEAKGRLEAEQHARLLGTLLGTLTDSGTPEDLAANWQRVGDHFDLLLDRPEALGALEQTILQLAVRGLLVSQVSSDQPASSLLDQIRTSREQKKTQGKKVGAVASEVQPDEVPFEVPESWAWSRFGQVAEIASDLVSPAAHGPEWQVAPDCIEKGTGRLLAKRTVADADVKSANHRFHPGQIIYSKIRPSLSKAVIVDFAGLCSADMYPINSKISSQYLLLVILSRCFLDQVAAAENRVKMPKLNQEALTAFLVPVPPLAEQERIVARVTDLRRLCTDLRLRLSRSRTMQAALAEALIDYALAA